MNTGVVRRVAALAATPVAGALAFGGDIFVNPATGISGATAGYSWTVPLDTLDEALSRARSSPGSDTIHLAVGRYEAPPGGWEPEGGLTITGGYVVTAFGFAYQNRWPATDADRTLLSGASSADTVLLVDTEILPVTLDNVALVDSGDSALVIEYAAVDASQVLFRGNGTSGSGGAVYAGYRGGFTAVECDFIDNFAGIDGGAIYWIRESDPQVCSIGGSINRCLFDGNAAGVDAGAVLVGTPYPPAVGNSIFTDNAAGNCGGALLLVSPGGGPANVFGNSLTRNEAGASGGGVWVGQLSAGYFQNNIVWGNTAPARPLADVDAKRLHSWIFRNNVIGSHPKTGAGGTGNINKDPKFADPDLLTLASGSPLVSPSRGSPAINAGLLKDVPTYFLDLDFDGDPRVASPPSPFGLPTPKRIDIGAQEVQP